MDALTACCDLDFDLWPPESNQVILMNIPRKFRRDMLKPFMRYRGNKICPDGWTYAADGLYEDMTPSSTMTVGCRRRPNTPSLLYQLCLTTWVSQFGPLGFLPPKDNLSGCGIRFTSRIPFNPTDSVKVGLLKKSQKNWPKRRTLQTQLFTVDSVAKFYFTPGWWGREVLRSACLSVCLSVCAPACLSQKLGPNFTKCYMRPWLGPALTTMQMQYIIYFRICEWQCFHTVAPMEQNQRQRYV